LSGRVTGRPKSVPSIHRKMERQALELGAIGEQVGHLAGRPIVEDVARRPVVVGVGDDPSVVVERPAGHGDLALVDVPQAGDDPHARIELSGGGRDDAR